MPLRAIARMIQTMLYGKRFFPYYVHNILGGIEEDGMSRSNWFQLLDVRWGWLWADMSWLGTGAVYSYDPVGSYERESCRAAGAAQSLIQPFLDNQVCCLLFLDLLHLFVPSQPTLFYVLSLLPTSYLSSSCFWSNTCNLFLYAYSLFRWYLQTS